MNFESQKDIVEHIWANTDDLIQRPDQKIPVSLMNFTPLQIIPAVGITPKNLFESDYEYLRSKTLPQMINPSNEPISYRELLRSLPSHNLILFDGDLRNIHESLKQAENRPGEINDNNSMVFGAEAQAPTPEMGFNTLQKNFGVYLIYKNNKYSFRSGFELFQCRLGLGRSLSLHKVNNFLKQLLVIKFQEQNNDFSIYPVDLREENAFGIFTNKKIINMSQQKN